MVALAVAVTKLVVQAGVVSMHEHAVLTRLWTYLVMTPRRTEHDDDEAA